MNLRQRLAVLERRTHAQAVGVAVGIEDPENRDRVRVRGQVMDKAAWRKLAEAHDVAYLLTLRIG